MRNCTKLENNYKDILHFVTNKQNFIPLDNLAQGCDITYVGIFLYNLY